eukprot:3866547-Lingulodinium_polyedra.AAC.1
MILVDTACSRSVAGMPWKEELADFYREQYKYELEETAESLPYRFGPGPKIMSTHAVLVPFKWGEAWVILR